MFLETIEAIVVLGIGFLGVAYCLGMAEYVKYNRTNNDSLEKKRILLAMSQECEEMHEEFEKGNYFAGFLEFFDILTAAYKYKIVSLFGTKLLENPLVWVVPYIIALPTGIKCGYRYLYYRCVRSHKNNINHSCCYRKTQ